MYPQSFKSQYNIEASVNQEVTRINREKKTVTVKELDQIKYTMKAMIIWYFLLVRSYSINLDGFIDTMFLLYEM